MSNSELFCCTLASKVLQSLADNEAFSSEVEGEIEEEEEEE